MRRGTRDIAIDVLRVGLNREVRRPETLCQETRKYTPKLIRVRVFPSTGHKKGAVGLRTHGA
ncbi:MAG: hypothetical protein ACRD1U_05165 [Vicinamibacterales bacterium]